MKIQLSSDPAKSAAGVKHCVENVLAVITVFSTDCCVCTQHGFIPCVGPWSFRQSVPLVYSHEVICDAIVMIYCKWQLSAFVLHTLNFHCHVIIATRVSMICY